MLIAEPLTFVKEFIEGINEIIGIYRPGYCLSSIRKSWLSFCIMDIFITNSICRTKFGRAGSVQYSVAALSWMFRNSKIPWEFLLTAGVGFILKRFGITEGILVIDDTGRKRSEKTKKISRVHKLEDKVSSGFVMGQCIVFLILVTPKITVPAGFSFYMPDPGLTEWNRRKKELKKAGIPGKPHPRKPPKNRNCPTKQEVSLNLPEQSGDNFPEVRIRCVSADALYCSGKFMGVSRLLHIMSRRDI